MKIFLDNSATTRPLSAVVEAMVVALVEGFGNPSSGHSLGRTAKAALSVARDQVADFVSADPDDIVFLSGATEANDAVLRTAHDLDGRKLISTVAEHPSTHGVFASSPERVVIAPLLPSGEVDLERLDDAMRAAPGALLAMSWVNGETGVVQPVDDICRRARKHNVSTLIDGAQALGRLPAHDFDFDYDYLVLSAHKMNGPKGVGCLVLGDGVDCPQLAAGGGQEAGRRSGTENLPGIVGFGAACAERGKTLEADLKRLGDLRDILEAGLVHGVPGARINGATTRRVPTNTNVTFDGVDGMALVARCDAAGVLFSQVSACSTGKPEPSKTLTAMGLDEAAAYSSARFSVSVMNTETDILHAVEVISREANVLREMFGRVA